MLFIQTGTDNKHAPHISARCLSTFIKVINFIRSRSLNHCIWKSLPGNGKAVYEMLLIGFQRTSPKAFVQTNRRSLTISEWESKPTSGNPLKEKMSSLGYLTWRLFLTIWRRCLSIQGPEMTICDVPRKFRTFLGWAARTRRRKWSQQSPCKWSGKSFTRTEYRHKIL